MSPERNLTDADIEAVMLAFEKRFYLNLGRGVWAIAWKAVVVGILAVAAYGAYHK